MPSNPKFIAMLDAMREVHERKNHDYARDDNPYSNFEYAAKVAEDFTDPVDRVFATLLGVKLARLQELRKGKTPNNESVEDTYLDLANYAAIWASRQRGSGTAQHGTVRGKADAHPPQPTNAHAAARRTRRQSAVRRDSGTGRRVQCAGVPRRTRHR